MKIKGNQKKISGNWKEDYLYRKSDKIGQIGLNKWKIRESYRKIENQEIEEELL